VGRTITLMKRGAESTMAGPSGNIRMPETRLSGEERSTSLEPGLRWSFRPTGKKVSPPRSGSKLFEKSSVPCWSKMATKLIFNCRKVVEGNTDAVKGEL